MPRGPYPVLAPLSRSYPRAPGRLLTCYAPVRHFTQEPKPPFSSDLHVLSTPPAFVLSQDQTLRTKHCFREKHSSIASCFPDEETLSSAGTNPIRFSKNSVFRLRQSNYTASGFLCQWNNKQKTPLRGTARCGPGNTALREH